MLLRNMNTALGLANGTRLIVQQCGRHFIQGEIITGTCAGDSVLIPRINIMPSDTNLPFQFTRRQFPVRPAFAMTINKAQGQTFKRVGVFLPQPCFSHGQLYVAVSRVGDPDGVKIMAITPPTSAAGAPTGAVETDNIVWTEVLA
jgi:ATP-dependent DNA helicase PIF1